MKLRNHSATAGILKQMTVGTVPAAVMLHPQPNHLTPTVNLDQPGFLRLEAILKLIVPVSRSSWYDGVARGIFPAPVSLGTGRAKGYRKSDIKRLVEALSKGADHV